MISSKLMITYICYAIFSVFGLYCAFGAILNFGAFFPALSSGFSVASEHLIFSSFYIMLGYGVFYLMQKFLNSLE